MKQSLQLRMSQQLNLTPQLAQSIKLLQLSTLDFQQEIERYLAENPLLERDDGGQGGEAEDAAPVESSPAESEREADGEGGELLWDEVRGGGSRDDDENDPALNIAQSQSLRDFLLSQAGLLPLAARERAMLELLIDALDDDGLLTQSLDEILAQLPQDLRDELEIDEVQAALGDGCVNVRNVTQGYTFDTRCDYTPRQRDIVLAGGLLNYMASPARSNV